MTYHPRAYAGIGARTTPNHILEAMTAVAGWMAGEQWTLRSGAAAGADTAFETGARDFNGRREIYLPWPSFNGHHSRLEPKHEAYGIAEEFHPAWHKLTRGGRALMARNAHQLLGPALRDPSKFILCWTPFGKVVGGTGQSIRMAQHYGIPCINLGAVSLDEAQTIIVNLNEG